MECAKITSVYVRMAGRDRRAVSPDAKTIALGMAPAPLHWLTHQPSASASMGGHSQLAQPKPCTRSSTNVPTIAPEADYAWVDDAFVWKAQRAWIVLELCVQQGLQVLPVSTEHVHGSALDTASASMENAAATITT